MQKRKNETQGGRLDGAWADCGVRPRLGADHYRLAGAVMAKEWFTVAELRCCAMGAYFDAQILRELGRQFQSLPKDKARVRPGVNDATHEAEFHISLFVEPVRRAIEAAYGPGSVFGRIARLGICRPVHHQAGVYVGVRGDAEMVASEGAVL